MKMIQKRNHEDAVSPVVAVMLMLVVTIIIAAVVSAFAGGLASGSDKSSSMMIQGDYSQASGLRLTNIGGDTGVTSELSFVLKPSKDFGSYGMLAWEFTNKTLIYVVPPAENVTQVGTSTDQRAELKKKVWQYKYSATSSMISTGYTTFGPGDTIYVHPGAIANLQGTTDSGSPYNYYGFNNPDHIGKSITVQMMENGKAIAETNVKITA